MQPRTHRFVISAAVAAANDVRLSRFERDLLRGNDDEDDFVIGGLRLRAPGLTHTYRPGSRFGELGAPSAKLQLERWVARAHQGRGPSDAAYWLGRACHLLGDMAVPARTHGVWHLLGDPLEGYCEQQAPELPALVAREPLVRVDTASAGELCDLLARRSQTFKADTTRTPWGALAARFGRRRPLPAVEIERQARALVPYAVACTRALLVSNISVLDD